SVGKEPIGDRPEPTALRRGWLTPPTVPYDFANTSLFIVQHAAAGPIKLALDTEALSRKPGDSFHYGPTPQGTRVLYRTNTEPGSSGSPCFGPNWELAALHHVGDPTFAIGHQPYYNQGIPIARIVDDLSQRGVAWPKVADP